MAPCSLWYNGDKRMGKDKGSQERRKKEGREKGREKQRREGGSTGRFQGFSETRERSRSQRR